MSGDGGFDLTQFYEVFFAEAGENLATMERLLLGLDTGDGDDETLHAIFRCAHSIKGGAATFGFDEIAQLTHVMETLLDRLRRHELAPTPAMVDALLAACDSLGAALQVRQEGQGESPDTAALRAQLTALSAGEAAGTEAAASPVAPAVSAMAAVATVASTEAAAIAIASSPMPGPDVEVFADAAQAAGPVATAPLPPGIRELEMLAGPLPRADIVDDLLTLFREVQGLGDLVRVDDAPGQPADHARFKLRTGSSDGDLLDLCGFHLPAEQVRLRPWGMSEAGPADQPETAASAAHAATLDVPTAAQVAVEAAETPASAAAPDPAAPGVPDASGAAGASAASAPSGTSAANTSPAANTPHAPPRKASSETLRVSVDKVDQLINMMGELVITQAMLAQRAARLSGEATAQLSAGLVDLERTTRDLQESVMSMRMIPMGDVFGRFPRMLRDLAARLGKEVDLRTVGEATELDKGMIEKLTDPLTHLVRNAVDHGVEAPEAREAAGKPRRGTVTLSAAHEGGSIVIRVKDDGRGLDRERLLDKARRQGLPVSADMADAQVWQLIFAPGFSTAEQVTDVSGRGVGMDVVKRNIQALGGSVEIDNRRGEGMCVSVRLPLTLAIMDGMSVTSGGELYVLPLSCVVESLQVNDVALQALPGGDRVVRVREDWLPVVGLAEAFHPGAARACVDRRMHVVIEAEGRRVALEVDQLVGQQQVVVKNLEANYRRVSGISGATIMADGRVALILDVASLVRRGVQ